MTDKELLELAAKAAGIEGIYTEENRMIREFCFQKYTYIKTNIGQWNPLTDDGDALRLAVKLDIHILRYGTLTSAKPCFSEFSFDERDNENAMQATRRAIVRAAAEIGRVN